MKGKGQLEGQVSFSFLILYFNKYRNKKVYFLYVYDVNVNKYVFEKKKSIINKYWTKK